MPPVHAQAANAPDEGETTLESTWTRRAYTAPVNRQRTHAEHLSELARDTLAIRDLERFVYAAWHLVEPAPLVNNWHIRLICRALQKLTEDWRSGVTSGTGDPLTLVINIPPGHAKSLLVSVFWPAWKWLTDPSEKALYFAHLPSLLTRDAMRTRRLIGTAWYRRLAGIAAAHAGQPHDGNPNRPPWDLEKDSNEKLFFENTAQGCRAGMSIESGVTGHRGDGFVLDDPYDVKAATKGTVAQIAARMQSVVDIFDQVLSTRVNDQEHSFVVLIMQRIHPDDLAGVLLRRPGVRSVVLPAEYRPAGSTPQGGQYTPHPEDPRTVEGELLFPAKFPAIVQKALKIKNRPKQYAAQQQQNPTDEAGKIFKLAWARRWRPETLPVFDEIVITVDGTFDDTEGSDDVAIEVWGRKGVKKYLLWVVARQMTFTETLAEVGRVRQQWQAYRYMLVEKKANGAAIIDVLKAYIPNIVPFDPGRLNKKARAEIAAVDWEVGNVYLPYDAAGCPGFALFEAQVFAFPESAGDDMVDAMSQLFMRWATFFDPMQAVKSQFEGLLGIGGD